MTEFKDYIKSLEDEERSEVVSEICGRCDRLIIGPGAGNIWRTMGSLMYEAVAAVRECPRCITTITPWPHDPLTDNPVEVCSILSAEYLDSKLMFAFRPVILSASEGTVSASYVIELIDGRHFPDDWVRQSMLHNSEVKALINTLVEFRDVTSNTEYPNWDHITSLISKLFFEAYGRTVEFNTIESIRALMADYAIDRSPVTKEESGT